LVEQGFRVSPVSRNCDEACECKPVPTFRAYHQECSVIARIPNSGQPHGSRRSACLPTGTSVRISSLPWVEDAWDEGEWFPEALSGGGTAVCRANSNRLWAREKCRAKANIRDKLIVWQTKGSGVGPGLKTRPYRPAATDPPLQCVRYWFLPPICTSTAGLTFLSASHSRGFGVAVTGRSPTPVLFPSFPLCRYSGIDPRRVGHILHPSTSSSPLSTSTIRDQPLFLRGGI